MHALVLALLLLGTADPLIIDTSKMEENQKVTSTHDGTTVTVLRRGDTRHVLVEKDNFKDEVVITRKADGFSVGTVKRSESFMVRPLRIIVDGIPIEPFVDDLLLVPRGSRARYYVCPFDGTIVRAAEHNLDQLKCPIDGMVMQPRIGPPNKIFLLDKD